MANNRSNSDDIIRSTIAEISMFLLFFSLFMLLAVLPGLDNGREDEGLVDPLNRERDFGITFESASIKLVADDEALESVMVGLVNHVIDMVRRHDANLIEIVGYADIRRVTGFCIGRDDERVDLNQCQSDEYAMIDRVNGEKSPVEIRSNADLALLRAVVVAAELKMKIRSAAFDLHAFHPKDARKLIGLRLHPISASYLYDENNNLHTDRRGKRNNVAGEMDGSRRAVVRVRTAVFKNALPDP